MRNMFGEQFIDILAGGFADLFDFKRKEGIAGRRKFANTALAPERVNKVRVAKYQLTAPRQSKHLVAVSYFWVLVNICFFFENAENLSGGFSECYLCDRRSKALYSSALPSVPRVDAQVQFNYANQHSYS